MWRDFRESYIYLNICMTIADFYHVLLSYVNFQHVSNDENHGYLHKTWFCHSQNVPRKSSYNHFAAPVLH